MRRDLGQPDRRFDRLDLAEERTDAAELVVPPVLKQAGRFGRDLPMIGVGQAPPCVHVLAHSIDDRGRVILLLFRRKPFAFVENDLLLRWRLAFSSALGSA